MVCTFSVAQQNSAVRGGLAGIVTDAGGAVIPNAKVVVLGPQGTVTLTADGSGHYQALGLTPGLYTITVTAPGFETFVSKDNEVTIDHTANLNAKMAIGKTDVTVEVDAGATAIDVENTSVNTAITEQFYSAMPLPRNVSGAFYVAPGVVSGGGTGTANPSIGGSSGLENLYTADGVTITDQSYGGLGVYTTSYGSLGTGINLSFVKEVDVKTAAFEPKYGQADGGIVEIVTKSGTSSYHGALNAYVTPEFGFANAKHLQDYGYVFSSPANLLAQPAYEGSAEFGGYIPGFKDKLFFFGAFDPTLNRNAETAFCPAVPNPARVVSCVPFASLGKFYYSTTSANWAGKLTYTPFASTVVEGSSYGDPSRRNVNPNNLAASFLTPVSSSYDFGTRNSVFRVSSEFLPHLTFSGSYSYNTEHFAESPEAQSYSISDQTAPTAVPYGFGQYNTTRDANWQLQGEIQANYHFLGKHTTMVGYLFDHVDFDNATLRTGANFAIPTTNAAGATISEPAGAGGSLTNATFYLKRADNTPSAGVTGDVGCTYCAFYNGNQVYLQEIRGTYKGSVVAALSRYKTAYGNEVWSPEKHVTVNAGLRWEEQAYGGSLLTYYWRDNWSPRLGITVDPFGDRKSKVFFNYSRYQNPLPLDAAIRQLGNEKDDTNFYFAPIADDQGNAVLDANGSVQPNVSVALNGTPQCTAESCTTVGNFKSPNFGSSTGEGILPGTKMEYTNEYVLGVEREVSPGMIVSARYMDRQFGRIVEDIGSQSPEVANSFANTVTAYAGGIANPSSKSDYFTNEQEVTYSPSDFAAANGGRTPDQTTAGNYVPVATGCTYQNDINVLYGGYFLKPDQTPYNGSCLLNATTADTLGADGQSDGFADPRRHYQALELELNRTLRNHWQARINYRYAKLWGNYEGFFRNDNGQSDPGISSLFDFTTGQVGLLGDQFKRGYLNTDHRNVANALIAYTLDKSTPFVGRFGNGLTIGTWLHATTGAPLSEYYSHPVYDNAGEVPVGGRGTKGTLPTAIQLDMSATDSVRFHDKYTVRGTFDAFNVTDSQPTTGQNQNYDTSFGSPQNPDYQRPSSFQAAFRCRFALAFEF
jgi:hypothetical protein